MENVLFDMRDMPILYAQMIQESPDVMTLEYVPLGSLSREDVHKLRQMVKQHLPSDFKINIRSVKEIERTVSGKALSLRVR